MQDAAVSLKHVLADRTQPQYLDPLNMSYGDGVLGLGRGEGGGIGSLQTNDLGRGIGRSCFAVLLCVSSDSLESVIINAACRMRP